jgi:transposase
VFAKSVFESGIAPADQAAHESCFALGVGRPIVGQAKKINRARSKTRRCQSRGRPPLDDRLMVEAMIYVLRTGVPWRDLPSRFGNWSGVYTRWRRWTASGLWDRLLSAVMVAARGTTRFADTTHIKLHQDGANPAGGQAAQAIGRTKGGLNTKVLALVDSYGRAVALSVHLGPRNDVRTMDEHACLLRGRTLVADKGFDADGLRARIQHFNGLTCIPRRAKCGGSRPFSRRLYRRRHRVENFWCRLKRHRRLSTRYDKLASTFLGFIQLATVLDWLKN